MNPPQLRPPLDLLVAMVFGLLLGISGLDAQTLYAPGGAVGSSTTANVGIGTASPAYKLHVSGSFSATSGNINGRTIATFSQGTVQALANTGYSGWYRLARSLQASGASGMRGGARITVTATGGWLSPSQHVIEVFKNWTDSCVIATVQNRLGGYFSKFRIALDGDYAYLEGYIPSLNLGGTSWFSIVVENQGYVLDSWTAYDEVLTPGLPSPVGSSALDVVNNGTSLQSLGAAGSVGVGIANPGAAIDVIRPGNTNVYENGIRVNCPDAQGQYAFVGYGQGSADAYFGAVYTGSSGVYGAITLRQYTVGMTYRDALKIDYSGNVGIGTTNPTQKLSVNGTIRAKEVIVEASPWPDDVFDRGYKLKALGEVEAFINVEGHLPDMPSAEAVAEQGIEIGQMQKMLLRKIEELTLHQIAQEKELAAAVARIASLESENAALRKQRK